MSSDRESFLTASECAERRRVALCDWWGIAKRSAALRAARREVGRYTFWLESGFNAWLRAGAPLDAVHTDPVRRRGFAESSS